MNNTSYHHDNNKKFELLINSSSSTKSMEIIPNVSNAMESAIQNRSNHLNPDSDNSSDVVVQGNCNTALMSTYKNSHNHYPQAKMEIECPAIAINLSLVL